MKMFENLGRDRDDCLKLASKVLRGTINPHTIESLKLQVYEDGGYWLMRIEGDLSSEAVPRVLSVRRTIIENTGMLEPTLIVLLPANAGVSLEASTSLTKQGAVVLRQDEVEARPGL